MKAMILAAGRGERMRPLTDTTPKPLLEVRGRPLISHIIERMRDTGIKQFVINHSWLGEQIVRALGNGDALKVSIQYSAEPSGALETAGGIRNALSLLGDEAFIVCNGDLWTNFDFSRLRADIQGLAHLVLVDNPAQHPDGDFVLDADVVRDDPEADKKLTFSGIGVYRPELFKGEHPQRFALAPLLRQAMQDNQVSGEHFTGQWNDVGTPERLAQLQDSQ